MGRFREKDPRQGEMFDREDMTRVSTFEQERLEALERLRLEAIDREFARMPRHRSPRKKQKKRSSRRPPS